MPRILREIEGFEQRVEWTLAVRGGPTFARDTLAAIDRAIDSESNPDYRRCLHRLRLAMIAAENDEKPRQRWGKRRRGW